MSQAIVAPSRLCGSVTAPPSKSLAHRAILCAALARGISRITHVADSEDMRATIGALEILGVQVQREGDIILIDSSGKWEDEAEIDCLESGSTLRFLIPILAALGISAKLTGQGRLPYRPLNTYLECLPSHGAILNTHGGLPLEIDGGLIPGEYELPGNISSQFITGLLLALPLLPGDSCIRLTTPLESAGYIDLTLSVLHDFGINIRTVEGGWEVPGWQQYQPRDYTVEGDWSQAAFFLAAGALGGEISIHGLRRDSAQGDRESAALFQRFGAQVEWQGEALTVSGAPLSGIPIDATQIPDLVPVLAATAALAEGRTVITGAARLRLKESDRLEAMTEALAKLGARITQQPDGLIIDGVPQLSPGTADGCNDHRIVMALAIAALQGSNPTIITDANSVAKSYPNFFEEYNRLGGKANVV
ncbi:MAG: 3-phosphoshikimate 1-carboxyvinyltransferase [Clostridium sp.]|uniref:3-phosphoshikimate 1-carboxyvinyltransferase n=1 Tax=Clostridium sp. TaxID=1506 RepID=UPI002906F0EF|nr:3-phosphoshikimate 1-carboxyvinyltransferase [Clostridium sp.]MDU7338171.1 3-phosphoshikimate 1-carboxyvinyltransferase [Clostridium sp.]